MATWWDRLWESSEQTTAREENAVLRNRTPEQMRQTAEGNLGGVIAQLRALGSQEEEEAVRDVGTDVAERGIGFGTVQGYEADRSSLARGKVRAKTELSIQDRIGAELARLEQGRQSDISQNIAIQQG